MNSMLLRSFVALSALGVSACASVQRGAGFEDIQRTVATHVGAAVQWDHHPALDTGAKRITDSLLTAELSVESAVQIALLNNRSLQATYEELGVSQSELVQAGLLANPVISGGMEFVRGISSRGLTVGIAQGFLDLFQLPQRRQVAASLVEQTKLEIASEVFDLAVETRSAFYDAQATEQTLTLRQSVVEAARLSADIAQRLHTAGNITDLELATRVSFYETAQLDLLDADAEVADARQALVALMGLTIPGDSLHLPLRLPQPFGATEPVDSLIKTALATRLDLASARSLIVSSGQQAGLAKTEALIPDFEIEAEWERSPGGERSIKPGIAVQIPLFDQGQAISAGYQARIRAAQEQYAALGMQTGSEVRRAWLRTELLRERAERLLNVVVPLRTKVVDETLLQYNGMLVGVFQLLEAKSEQVESARAYVDALHEYWIARTELEHAVGMRLASSTTLSTDPLASPASAPAAGHEHEHEHHQHH